VLYKESKYIYKLLNNLELTSNDTILNLGSSTAYFRTTIQPYINNEIFSKLENNNINIIHSDIKDEKGVELVGDIFDNNFQIEVINLKPKVIICSNLLEHVLKRENFIKELLKIIPVNSFLIVTVPYKFPYHPDPIDTMYRPSLSDLKKAFSKLCFIDGKIVLGGFLFNWMESKLSSRIFKTFRHFIRILLPIYKPISYRQSLSSFRNTKVTVALFKSKKLDL
jgi:hypothetical protein